MTDLPISEELAARLRRLAEHENRSLEAVLSDFVSERQHKGEQTSNVVAADRMRAFAEKVAKLNLHSGQSDISSRFDDYVEQSIAEHFKERQKDE